MSKQANSLNSTKLEKVFYAFGDVGGNLIWSFASAFIVLYYTDSAMLSAAFAGTMMLICRFFDGLSDILMGIIIDKTRARWGKARSWILFSTLPLGLVFVATFNIPAGLSETSKNAYAFITYFLLSVVFYTASNLAYHTMLQRFSLTSQDRSVVSVVRTIFVLITVLTINLLTPALLASMGGEKSQIAWTTMSLIFGILAVIFLFITFFGVKEKLPVTVIDNDGKKQTVPMKRALKTLLSSRYFYIAIFLFIVFYVSNGTQGIGIYYARDVLGDPNLFGIISLISILPMLVVMPFAPLLFKKIGKRNTMIIGLIISLVATSISLINPFNVLLYLITSVFRAAGLIPLAAAIFTLAGDVVDYNDMKTGIRAEGITTAANSVGSKLGIGIGSALLGWMLAWGKYDGSLAVQPESAINAMIVLSIVIPLVITAISVVLLLFWNLDKYQPEVQAYLKDKTDKLAVEEDKISETV